MNQHSKCIKRAIHRSSKLEFLEHRKEKLIVKVENLSNLEQMIRSGGIQTNLKSKRQSLDSKLRPRCESSGKAKDLPTLAPRVEARNETRNHPRSTQMGGEGNRSQDKWHSLAFSLKIQTLRPHNADSHRIFALATDFGAVRSKLSGTVSP
ncbi:hypothetical protein AVEN_4253-1, partial [Araneus ventricosus]|uniref:Uncharacterized protein n=1 Tax=Araneus ventricosus TaxID=182803 RepID=A0A4Y2SLR5_ARAVE